MGKKVRKLLNVIIRIIRRSRVLSSIVVFLFFGYFINDNDVNSEIYEAVLCFSPNSLNKKGKVPLLIKYILVYNRWVYKITFDEYYLFHFRDLSAEGKRKYVGDVERRQICLRLGTEKTREIFDNKYQTYLTFEEFYGRKVILIINPTEKELYDNFVDKCSPIIVKPLHGCSGKGIICIRPGIQRKESDVIFHDIIAQGGAVLEELIDESDPLKCFHPESVNTVRIATVCNHENATVLFAFFRMGKGSSIVDNGGSGGIFASVDVDTGIVKTCGITEKGQQYMFHPDSGKQIIGFQIPKWDEAIILVKKAALIVKEQVYIGWDLALTDNGWVVVEGNRRGQLLQQYCEEKGCRELLEQYIQMN